MLKGTSSTSWFRSVLACCGLNYFQDCENGDFFAVKHSDSFDDDFDKLCGDLSDWMPMNTTIPIHFHSHAEQR